MIPGVVYVVSFDLVRILNEGEWQRAFWMTRTSELPRCINMESWKGKMAQGNWIPV
jgi:hypothetical protein